MKKKHYRNLKKILDTQEQKTNDKLNMIKMNIVNDPYRKNAYSDLITKNIYTSHKYVLEFLENLVKEKVDETTKFAEGDIRNTLPRYTEEARASNKALLSVIERFAQEKEATNAQVALAWILAQKPWIVPIPGTTKTHRLTENIGAVSITFTDSELAELTTASEEVKIMGKRYTDAMENSTGL
jgi:diketogulonate reductase-like aldo/keto reductase